MDLPVGWISETELRAAIEIADEDQKKFHRNLVNWRDNGLLPRSYDGREVPFSLPLGFAMGNEAWHPPITIEMVRRINAMRHRGTMDEWLWQLWIEGFPIDIVDWCRQRLLAYAGTPPGVADKQRLVESATRKPAKRTDGRRTFYCRLRVHGWYALMTWAVHIAIGARPPQSLFDPVSAPLKALAKLLQPLFGASDVRERLVGTPIEDMGMTRLLSVLDEVDDGDLERVREDCWALSRVGERGDLVGLVLAAMWRRQVARAIVLPALISLRRSPRHRESLVTALGLSLPFQLNSVPRN